MKSRWLGLVLLTWAAMLSQLHAQGFRFVPQDRQRPSHMPIGDGLETDLNPEQRLARRLLNQRKQDQETDEKIKKLVGELLADRELMRSLEKSLSREDIKRLKENLGDVGGLAKDPALQKLFKESFHEGKLTQENRELINRLKTKFGEAKGNTNPIPPDQQPVPPDANVPINPDNPGPIPPQQPAPSQPQPVSPWERPSGGSTGWWKDMINRSSGDFSRWLDSPSGKSMRDNFRDIARRYADSRASTGKISQQVRGVGKYLPRVGNWVPRNLTSRLVPRIGSLPRLPSASALPRVSASGAGTAEVIVAVAALIILVLWKTRGWWQAVVAARLPKSWRIGPWPVRPNRVTTRADLVRAFEYLAVLCLGSSARTHHHLELGRLMGNQPSLDPDRRRDAGETSARLYEQARYTPDEEPLNAEDMAAARRELCYLAGEPAV